MSEQETTHNFMAAGTNTGTVAGASIDSFSQLPFIRSTPTRDKQPTNSSTGAPLRLFGFNFHKESSSNQTQEEEDYNSPNKETKSDNNTSMSSLSNETTTGRKFECHYCCRNFPTSQALGGHQNAHKRERQQAKRAQFQTSMPTEGQMYSPFAYYHLGSIPSAARFEPATVPPHYPPWVHGTSTPSSGPRFYGGLGSVSEPINGSPVSAPWRLPVHGGFGGFGSMHHNHPMALPLFGGVDTKAVVASPFSPTTASNNLGQERGVKDGVSLDLHL